MNNLSKRKNGLFFTVEKICKRICREYGKVSDVPLVFNLTESNPGRMVFIIHHVNSSSILKVNMKYEHLLKQDTTMGDIENFVKKAFASFNKRINKLEKDQ